MKKLIQPLLIALSLLIGPVVHAQKEELYEKAAVQERVQAAIANELREGLWAEAIAGGELTGEIDLELTIDDKGRAETVFVPRSTLAVNWKNRVKDQWMDHRFDLRLPKGHKETVTVSLRFPMN
jgi:hypothetical protein